MKCFPCGSAAFLPFSWRHPGKRVFFPPLAKGGLRGVVSARSNHRVCGGVSSRHMIVLWALVLVLSQTPTAARADEVSAPTYERDIKPILAKRCTVCHSSSKQDDLDLSGGLALDSIEGVLAGTRCRKVVMPRQADEERAFATVDRS